MPGIVGYTKKFIILKKDFCTISGIAPKGHGKLEIRGLKGSLNISIEGSESNEIYDVMLVWKNSSFNLGKVYSDKNGKTREDINFNIMDLESKGFTLDKLNGLVLIRDTEILLGGYMAKEDGSIEIFSRDIKTKAKPIENIVEDNSFQEDLSPEVEHFSDEPILKKSEGITKLTGDGLAEGRIDFDKLKDEEPLTNEYLIEKEGFNKEIVQQYEEVFEGKEESYTDFIVEEYKPEFEPIGDLTLMEEYVAVDEEQLTDGFIINDVEPESIILEIEEPEDISLVTELQFDVDELQFDVDELQFDVDELQFDVDELQDSVEIIDMDEDTTVEILTAENDDIDYNFVEAEEPTIINIEEISEPEYIPLDDVNPKYEQLNNEAEDIQVPYETHEPQYIKLDEEAEEEYIVNDLPRDQIPSKEEVKKYIESNQEIVKINNMDYEHNRRVIQKNQTTDYVLNILRYFSVVDPFRQNLDGYRWWRIDFQDEAKGFLPYFSYLVGGEGKFRRTSSTTAREMMNLYNHYLFGLYSQGDDVKYYVYAVPGGFYKDEHPHGGSTGFNTWFSGNEVIGYWLLYIDPLTGKVIFPINPMIPVD